MKINPIDNLNFGAYLPPKQGERAVGHNGRMVCKDNIDKGLWALSDWLKYNTESAWKNEHRVLSDHDYNYFREVIESARDYLKEEE